VKGNEIKIPASLSTIYPICVVSDHYPALSFQARQFLKSKTTDVIKTTLIGDVFLIDVLTEMLESPLRLFSYLEFRSKAGNDLLHSHEIVVLGYHLRRNLWLGDYDWLVLEDDISTDLDIAMTVRREGVQGERTPPGILTQLQGTSVGRIIGEIEKRSDTGSIALRLNLLTLSETAAKDISLAIDKITREAGKDGKEHDVTVAIGEALTGITIHCNSFPDFVAAPKLKLHCAIRKYSRKASTWFGLTVAPGTGALRLGLMLSYPWQFDSSMEKTVASMPKGVPASELRKIVTSKAKGPKKIGRNKPCPCGSGLKYKKCCLRKG
jgi:hypothetical protein